MCTISGLGQHIGRFIGRLSTDYRSTIGQQLTDYRLTVDQLSVDSRPIDRPTVDQYIGRQWTNISASSGPIYRPAVDR